MKKLLACAFALFLALGLCACGINSSAASDAFTLKIRCESPDIYSIFYTCYIDGQTRGHGGMSDLDGQALTDGTGLELNFSRSFFEEGDDIAGFSIDFSPYGKDDVSEITTTAPLNIAAEYGKTYQIVFSGDRENGFQAQLIE